MTEAVRPDHDEISLFALGNTLLRARWRIFRWMLLGAAITALSAFLKPAVYLATVSFIPQGNDASRSDLASLAGQFGVSLPEGAQSLSPEFYSELLKSRVLLLDIARDTLIVQERGGERSSFLDLLEIREGAPERLEEAWVELLKGIITASVVRATGVVKFSVATEWPSVSLAIATSLVDGVNDFNQRTRQGQAVAEREFVEERVAVAATELRDAEDRLERFLMTNRQFASSPELTFQHDRLQRDVLMRQQLFTSLTQSYEEVRIREVRDTPVITMIEPPSVSTMPEPRRRVMFLVLGLLLGGFGGVLVAFSAAMIARAKEEGDADAEEFLTTLGILRDGVLKPSRRFRGRVRE